MTRPLCPQCQLPLARCHCAWVQHIDNRVPVLIWQHPSEADHPKGSVRLLMASLQHCCIRVGEHFSPDELMPDNGAGWHLLFPEGRESSPASVEATDSISPDPIRGLLVLDGTWRKSRKLLHTNPWLQRMPRLSVSGSHSSRYKIRKAEKAGQLSTLEATCLALQQLEDTPQVAQYNTLLDRFEGYQQQLLTHPGRTENRKP